MGFWKKLSKSLKEGSEKLADEIKRKQEISRIKRQILERFEMSELKKICRDYGIGEPSPYTTDIISGKKSKITLTRNDYIKRIINKLTLDQIKNFSEKNRIKIYDILKEEKKLSKANLIDRKEPEKKVTTIEIKRQSELDSILDAIANEFEPEDVRDENDFEKQLTQFLKYKYPERIQRQVPTRKGKIDIVIDNKYAIELKIADSKGKLRDLVGQALSYKKVYDDVAVILLDVGKMMHSEIREYTDDYEEHKIKCRVIEGVLRKRKTKSKQINIRI